MRIYLAGPMSAIKDHNYPAFEEAKRYLLFLGHEVISPVDIGRKLGYVNNGTPPTQAQIRELIQRDLTAVAYSDGVYMLEGWAKSPGARLEHDLARFLNLNVYFQGVFEPKPASRRNTCGIVGCEIRHPYQPLDHIKVAP